MREFEFGLFDGEAADCDCDFINGRSILVYGNTTNQIGTPDYNPEYGPIGKSNAADSFMNAGLINIANDQIKAVLGQIPVLVQANLSLMLYSSPNAMYFNVFRMLTSWDVGDSDNRYSDITGVVTWYGDAYFPYPDQDRVLDELDRTATQDWTANTRFELAITSAVELALRNNQALRLFLGGYVTGGASSANINWKPPITSKRPLIRFHYFFPIEFFKDSGGNLDNSQPILDTEAAALYLGAVEHNQVSSAVRCHFRNLSAETHHVEIFDDHPEYLEPIQRVGSTGKLDYIDLSDASVSQRYTAVFYSATQFEVKAEAWRDNSTSLHPQITGDPTWRGDTSSTFTAPSGGLIIPAAFWQPGTANADEWEVSVRGNTTDTSWPWDANDQVEITEDNAGSPDTGKYRPICGRRELSQATVAVDAATKLVPTRYVKPADWPVGTQAFIMNADNIDEGTVNDVQEADIGTPAFSGTGTDDLTASGEYNGSSNRTFRVEIDAGGTPGTFKWSPDGGSSWTATGVVPTGSAQLLENGVYITIPTGTAHTLADYWDIAVECWGVELTGLTPGAHSYAAGAIVGTTLPIRSLGPAVHTTVSVASGASETFPARLYLEDTSDLSAGDPMYVENVAGTNETAVIDTGGVYSTYVQMTAALTNDYAVGSFATKEGTGQDSFWFRINSNGVTVEQLKRLRWNVRLS